MDNDVSNDRNNGNIRSSHPHDDDCGGSLLLLHSSSRKDNVASVERSNSAGSVENPFFADMTLDYQLARMETTPRTDTKFASMAASSSSLMMLNLTPPVMPLTILDEELVEEEMMIDNRYEEISISHDNNHNSNPSHENNSNHDHDDDDVENSENNMDQLSKTISSVRGDVDDSDGNFIVANLTQEEEVEEEHLRTSFSSSDQQQQQHYLVLPYQRPSRPPRRPRDVSWMATAILIIPTGLIVPHVYYRRHSTNTTNDDNTSSSSSSWSDMVSSNSAHSTILLTTLTALATSLIVLRVLYSHPGGSDGDNSRYKYITRSLLLANQCCIWLHVIQIGLIYHYLSNVRSAILLPIGLVICDTLRKVTLATTTTTTAQRHQFQQQRLAAATSTTHDRITFFRALAVSSLDVLSRSLRRTSFVRALSILLLIQFAFTFLWWSALVTVLSSESMTASGSILLTKVMHITWLLLIMIAGNWATSIICHLLGYVAAGGVSAWFRAQQVSIMERLKLQQQQQEKRNDTATFNAEGMNEGQTVWQDDGNAEDGYDDNAYQTADASVYATLSDFDEGLDDEYDDDEDPAEGVQYYDHLHHPQQQHINKEETVKSFLLVGCTIGFGSVAQCGLLSGVAQLFGTLVRIVDTTLPPPDEFRGMAVSTTVNDDTNAQRSRLIVSIQWKTTENAVRNFIRSHSDIAMSHVAVYFKSYQRAANDVANLIEISGKSLQYTTTDFCFPRWTLLIFFSLSTINKTGVQAVIQDDIASQMCISFCHFIAGLIVLFYGMLLITHRNSFAPDPLTDASILEVLLVSYGLCYIIISTSLEPLRSAMKAVYVCFAEHPLSVSQTFPLIYQRLRRITETNNINI